jgi:hypothetical protein
MMVRLILMPLIPDFGESLKFPAQMSSPLSPKTRLVFTRDYRIFGQFNNFPDRDPEKTAVFPKELPAGVFISVSWEDPGRDSNPR